MNREQVISTLKISYVALSLVTIIFLIYRRPEPIETPPPVDTKYTEVAAKLEKQTKAIEAIEKRYESQLEFNKRLCEYVNVITVEKKIVPRQCQPNYQWP